MQDLKDVLGIVAEALKAFTKGIGNIANKVDDLAKSVGASETEPKAKILKPKAAKTATTKTVKVMPKKAKNQVAKKPTVGKPASKVAVNNKAAKKVVTKSAQPKPAPKKKPEMSGNRETGTALDMVLKVIGDAGDGIGPSGIMEKTGFDAKKVSNIIHRLKQQGKIKAESRGMYSRITGDMDVDVNVDKDGNR